MGNNSGSFDPEQYKEAQRRVWDSAAHGWQTWWETFESGAQKLSDRMVELAQIKSGHRVLDLATGIGEPAVTAARHVRPAGLVLATDISAQMLKIARSRAASLGLQDIMEFKEGDVETLDLRNRSFDAVLSRWGLMFLPNLVATLKSMREVLVPDGVMSAAVWSTPSKVPMLDTAFSTVRRYVGTTQASNIPGPFSLSDANALQHSFVQAGFRDVHIEKLTVTFSFESPESYTRFQQAIAAPIHAMISRETEERKKEIWQAITQAVLQYAGSDNLVNLNNEVICVTARR
jgi:ubiquinone/menaquinone biosynthesis C-methylase UbiE